MDFVFAFLDKWNIVDYVIAGVIGTIIAFLLNIVISFFRDKKKKYCISKRLVSSSVYQQTDEDGLKIKVLYNDKEIEGPISIIKLCIKNDGLEDIAYSKRIRKLFLSFNDVDVLDLSVISEIADVKPVVNPINDGRYEIKWDLLKRNESIIIKVVAKGNEFDISNVKFEIRADGINEIKTPEYKVNEVMSPVLLVDFIIIVPMLLFYPSSESFVGIMPMKVFVLIILVFMTIFLWVTALLKRIKWLKEQ
jgi:hypothetical protein